MNPAEAPHPMPPTNHGDTPVTSDDDEIKRLIASVTEGLTDDDLRRPSDPGRKCGPFLDGAGV
jgi:hypothetical protein